MQSVGLGIWGEQTAGLGCPSLSASPSARFPATLGSEATVTLNPSCGLGAVACPLPPARGAFLWALAIPLPLCRASPLSPSVTQSHVCAASAPCPLGSPLRLGLRRDWAWQGRRRQKPRPSPHRALRCLLRPGPSLDPHQPSRWGVGHVFTRNDSAGVAPKWPPAPGEKGKIILRRKLAAVCSPGAQHIWKGNPVFSASNPKPHWHCKIGLEEIFWGV